MSLICRSNGCPLAKCYDVPEVKGAKAEAESNRSPSAYQASTSITARPWQTRSRSQSQHSGVSLMLFCSLDILIVSALECSTGSVCTYGSPKSLLSVSSVA